MPHCVDCKYFSQQFPNPTLLCTHPEAVIANDPVTGATAHFTCQEMRHQYKCTPEGVLFEYVERNKFWAFVKNAFLV